MAWGRLSLLSTPDAELDSTIGTGPRPSVSRVGPLSAWLLSGAGSSAGAVAVVVNVEAAATVGDTGDVPFIDGLEDGRRCKRLGKSSSLVSLYSLAEGTYTLDRALGDSKGLTGGRPCNRLGISSSLASLVEGY